MATLKSVAPKNTWELIEFNRFGIMTLAILTQSMSGSVAVFYALKMPEPAILLPLSLAAAFTMGANAVCIAQASMKMILGAFALSVLTSLIIIAVGVAIV